MKRQHQKNDKKQFGNENRKQYLFINCSLFLGVLTYIDQVDQLNDIIMQNTQNFVKVLKDGQYIIQALSTLSHQFKIILYGSSYVQQQLRTISTLQQYIKQQNLKKCFTIEGIICQSKDAQKNTDQRTYLIKNRKGVKIFPINFNKDNQNQNILQEVINLREKYFDENIKQKDYIISNQEDNIKFYNQYKNYQFKICADNLSLILQEIIKQEMKILIDKQFVQTVFSKKTLEEIICIPLMKQITKNLRIINKFSIYDSILTIWYKQHQLDPILLRQQSENIAFVIYTDQQQQNIKKNNVFLEICLLQYNNKEYSFIQDCLLSFNIVKFIIRQTLQQKFSFLLSKIIKSQVICNLIQQYFETDKSLFTKMMKIVLKSRINKSIQMSSASAITLLNIAGQSFSGMDLNSISIPNADVSGGYFENANLQDSNLSNVVFDRCYCVGTKFNRSNMSGVKFGAFYINFNDEIHCFNIDKSDKYLLIGGYFGKVQLYDLKNIKKLNTWNLSKKIIIVKFSPDSKHFLVVNDSQIRIFNIESSISLLLQTKSTDILRSNFLAVQYNSDGSKIISATKNSITVWNAQKGVLIQQMNLEFCQQIFFLNEKFEYISKSEYRNIKIESPRTVQFTRTLEQTYPQIILCLSPQRDEILTSNSNNKKGRIWNLQKRQIIIQLIGHQKKILSADYSPDGTNIATLSCDNSIKIWERSTGQCKNTFYTYISELSTLKYFNKGNKIICNTNEKIKILEVNQKQNISVYKCQDFILSTAYSLDQKTMVIGSYKKIQILNPFTGCQIRQLIGHTNCILSLSYSSDGKILASSSYDTTIKLWDIQTGQNIKTLSGHKNVISSVCFSRDNKILISGSHDNTIKIWDVYSGKAIKTLEGHTESILTVSYSSDKKILSGSEDQTIKVWNIATGKTLRTLIGHKSYVKSVFGCSDGKKIISGSYDKTVKLWNIQNGQNLMTFQGHHGNIYLVMQSDDSKRIISGSEDNTIRIWDIQSGKNIKTLIGHNDGISSICYSQNRKKLITSSCDKKIQIWDISSKQQNKSESLQFMEDLKQKQFNLILNTFRMQLHLTNIQYNDIMAEQRIIHEIESYN